MKKGEIYWATWDAKKDNGYYHPIVILECEPDQDLVACIISRDGDHGNIPLDESHFDNSYPIKYGPSYLVKRKYYKIKGGLKAKNSGKLTEDGLRFIENALRDIKYPEISNLTIMQESEIQRDLLHN